MHVDMNARFSFTDFQDFLCTHCSSCQWRHVLGGYRNAHIGLVGSGLRTGLGLCWTSMSVRPKMF